MWTAPTSAPGAARRHARVDEECGAFKLVCSATTMCPNTKQARSLLARVLSCTALEAAAQHTLQSGRGARARAAQQTKSGAEGAEVRATKQLGRAKRSHLASRLLPEPPGIRPMRLVEVPGGDAAVAVVFSLAMVMDVVCR